MYSKIALSYLFSLCLLLVGIRANAQKSLPLGDHNFVGAYYISVGFDKTTHIVFPYKIVYVDLGSPDLIADKVEKVDNILKVKANVEGFAPTNITVLTGAGNLYSFIVKYEAVPSEINIVIKDREPVNAAGTAAYSSAPPLLASADGKAIFENVGFTYAQMDELSKKVVEQKRSVRDLGFVGNDISFAINGLYISGNAFFFHLHSHNNSYISYDIESIRFYIRDKKQTKRTVNQEVEIFPIHTYNQAETVEGKHCLDKVFIMEKITIPKDKYLVVEVYEKKGGRHASFNLESKDIISASLLK